MESTKGFINLHNYRKYRKGFIQSTKNYKYTHLHTNTENTETMVFCNLQINTSTKISTNIQINLHKQNSASAIYKKFSHKLQIYTSTHIYKDENIEENFKIYKSTERPPHPLKFKTTWNFLKIICHMRR